MNNAQIFDATRLLERKKEVTVIPWNLPEKKMAGEVSQGMLFDIGYAHGIVPCHTGEPGSEWIQGRVDNRENTDSG
jgi:hypothetical protein